MEDTNDASVPKISIGAVQHDVSMPRESWVDRVGRASHIVCCVVYPQNLMFVDAVFSNSDTAAFFQREIEFIAVVIAIQQP